MTKPTAPPTKLPAAIPPRPPIIAPRGHARPVAIPAAIAPPAAPMSCPPRRKAYGSCCAPSSRCTMRTCGRENSRISTGPPEPSRTFNRRNRSAAEWKRPTYSCPLHNSIRRGVSHASFAIFVQSSEVLAGNSGTMSKTLSKITNIRRVRICSSAYATYARKRSSQGQARTLFEVSQRTVDDRSFVGELRCSTPKFVILAAGCAL
jgi:hypothetical protein